MATKRLGGLALLVTASALAQGTGVIRGSVVAAGTILPVGGAVVPLTEDMGMPSGSARRYSSRTDRDGRFEFQNSPITRYRWSVTATGYKIAEGALTVTAAVTSLPIEIDKLGTISGRVLSSEGRPLAGVTVTGMAPWGSELAPVTSDSSGRFTLGVAPGRYYLVAHPGPRKFDAPDPKTRRVGWLNAFYPNSSTRAGAQVVIVKSGEDVVGLDIRVHEDPLSAVAGRVINAADRPVHDAAVILTPADPGIRFNLSTLTDEQGRYSFAGIPVGVWSLSAEAADGTLKVQGSATVTVADRPVDNAQIKILQAFSVSGRVNYATPTGNTGVFLVQETALARSRKGVMTRETGRFTIPDVYPGRYRIVPTGKPPGQFVNSVRLGGIEVMGREVQLTGDDPPITIDYINNGGIVKGVVRDGKRGYVVLVPVEETLRDSVFIETVFSDTEGRFEFLGVRPGDYYGFAFASIDTAAFSDPGFFRDLLPYANSVRVAPGESQVLEPVLMKWRW